MINGRNGYVSDLDRLVPKGDMIKLAVEDAAVDLLTTAQQISGKQIAFAVVEGDVRITFDGSDPVNTDTVHGMPFYDGAVFKENAARANAMKLIQYTNGGAGATVWIQVME